VTTAGWRRSGGEIPRAFLDVFGRAAGDHRSRSPRRLRSSLSCARTRVHGAVILFVSNITPRGSAIWRRGFARPTTRADIHYDRAHRPHNPFDHQWTSGHRMDDLRPGTVRIQVPFPAARLVARWFVSRDASRGVSRHSRALAMLLTATNALCRTDTPCYFSPMFPRTNGHTPISRHARRAPCGLRRGCQGLRALAVDGRYSWRRAARVSIWPSTLAWLQEDARKAQPETRLPWALIPVLNADGFKGIFKNVNGPGRGSESPITLAVVGTRFRQRTLQPRC